MVITEEMKEAALEVIDSHIFEWGPNVKELEKEVCNAWDVKHAICVSSGTAAIHLTLLAFGITAGDEVITVPNSDKATANCVMFVGAKPIFVDIDLETFNIDVDKIEKKITPKTKAILPVHMYGHPANIDSILEIANKHDLLVIEEACHASGSKYKNKWIGSFGDAACFSFSGKNIGVMGWGGVVTTNDNEIAEDVRARRFLGMRSYSDKDPKVLGLNHVMGEIEAAIGRIAFRHLNEWNETRRRNASHYKELLEGSPVRTPVEKTWAYHVYLHYVILASRRDELKDHLMRNGIEPLVLYPTIHPHYKYYLKQYGPSKESFPMAEREKKEMLALPVHPNMSYEKIDCVAETIKGFYKK